MKKLRYYFLILNYLESTPYPSREELMKYLAKYNCEVSERTFYRLLGELEADFNIKISLDYVGKGFAIEQETKEAANFLLSCIRNFSVIETLDDMDESGRFVIDFIESSRYNNFIPLELFQLVYGAIVSSTKISFNVKCLLEQETEPITVSPLFFKQLNDQWFLIARYAKELHAFNLATMENVTLTAFRYRENIKRIQQSYRHIIGLDFIADRERVVKLALDKKHKAILHNFAVQVDCDTRLCPATDRILLDFSARINNDLKRLIMSLGAGVEVIEPVELRESIIREYQQFIENHQAM